MGTAKNFDIMPFQIWKAHGNYEQPDNTVLQEITFLTLSTLDKSMIPPIVAIGVFKAQNDNYKLWKPLFIGTEECYLACDCVYSIMPDWIQGNTPLYEITDDRTQQEIKELFNKNFD